MLIPIIILNTIDILIIFLLSRELTKNYNRFTLARTLFGIAYGVVLGTVAYVFDGDYTYRIIVTMSIFVVIHLLIKKSLTTTLLVYSLYWIFGLLQFILMFGFQFIPLEQEPLFLLGQSLTLLLIILVCKFLPLNKWFRFIEEHLELQLITFITAFAILSVIFYWNFDTGWAYLVHFIGSILVVLIAIYIIGAKIVHARHTVPLKTHDVYHHDLGMMLKAYKEEDHEMITTLKERHQEDDLFNMLSKQLQFGKVMENIIVFIKAKQKVHNSTLQIQHDIDYLADHKSVGIETVVKMLSILLDNALESGTKKPIVVDLSIVPDFVHICVRNELKLQKDYAENISRMLTVDGYTTKKNDARGYGLTNLYHDIEQVDGRVAVTSSYHDAGRTTYLSIEISL